MRQQARRERDSKLQERQRLAREIEAREAAESRQREFEQQLAEMQLSVSSAQKGVLPVCRHYSSS